MPDVDASTFGALFFESTRAVLNWPALRAEQWPAAIEVVSERSRLGRLYLPWAWHARRGEVVNYSEPGARPMRIDTVPKRLPQLTERRRGTMLRLARALDREKPVLTLPAVRTKLAAPLLVDGCHRAGALMLAGCEFRIALFVLQAPTDGRTIVDLELLR